MKTANIVFIVMSFMSTLIALIEGNYPGTAGWLCATIWSFLFLKEFNK